MQITNRYGMAVLAGIMGALLLGGCQSSGPVDANGRPLIEKFGTIDLDLVETSPVVFNGKLYRFEYVREKYVPNETGDSYFRFVEHETGAATPAFAKGYHLGSAFVDGGKAYVTGVPGWGGDQIAMFVSDDLQTWERREVLQQEGMVIFNTSMCQADGRYVLMYEVGAPPELAGNAFTAYFLESDDLKTWRRLPNACNYAKDRYTAPHCLRYLDGWFYDFYLEHVWRHGGATYDQHVVRSKDLKEWELSPLNPVLHYGPADKQIANPEFTADQRQRIAESQNINNSDIDFCEYKGRLIINYSWGNQRGLEFLAEAVYRGTEEQFLRGWFPE